MWTRKRTVIAGGTNGDNDWMVYEDRQPVGRVHRSHLPDPSLSWVWAVQVQLVADGYARSLEAALEEVR